jgi:hypothetical protein
LVTSPGFYNFAQDYFNGFSEDRFVKYYIKDDLY